MEGRIVDGDRRLGIMTNKASEICLGCFVQISAREERRVASCLDDNEYSGNLQGVHLGAFFLGSTYRCCCMAFYGEALFQPPVPTRAAPKNYVVASRIHDDSKRHKRLHTNCNRYGWFVLVFWVRPNLPK